MHRVASSSVAEAHAVIPLAASGGLQLVLWMAAALLVPRSASGTVTDGLLPVRLTVLWAAAFGLYLWSVGWLLKHPATHARSGAALRVVLLFALLFRLPLWWSEPVLESDYYRYLWDGRVLLEGVHPGQHTPAEVEQAGGGGLEPALERMARRLDGAPELRRIFDQIEHRTVPSIYPPLSQAVFGMVAWLTPDAWSAGAQIRVLKALLLGFDVGSVWLLVGLLREVRKPPSLVLIYAWSPLVLKEFANSAHHDSIAVCGTLAMFRMLLRNAGAREEGRGGMVFWWWQAGAACAWAGAVLAKLYPLVLTPLLAAWWWRAGRWRMLAWLGLALGLMLAGYAAMPGGLTAVTNGRTTQGVAEYFRRWEMNDLLFSVVYENLKPPLADGRPSPWYAVTPVPAREWLVASVGLPGVNVAFRLAQLILGTVLGIVLVRLALAPWPASDRLALLQRGFLSLAWLWFLSATQNPWYWTWALSLLVFVRGPWLLVSGFAMLYYLRFWFAGLASPPPGGGEAFSGVRWFDEVVVWLEHGPILLLLAWQRLGGHSLNRGP